jgi:hypothetical protein
MISPSRRSFRKASLPLPSQLALHVDAGEFMRLASAP